MVSCTEFIPLYSELFKFLHKKKGAEEVMKYWEYVSDEYVQPLLGDKVRDHGMKGCFEYWTKSLNEENCDFTIIYNEDEEIYESRMYSCPSKGMLLKLAYTEPYFDYCGHCDVLYSKVLKKYGITEKRDTSEVDCARCSSVRYYEGKVHPEYAKISKYDNFQGLRLEIADRPKMLEFIKSANKDTPCGVYEFGEEGFINVIETQTKESLPQEYEAHKQYYDIHCVLSGEEKVYFGMAKYMKAKGDYQENLEATMYEPDDKVKSITYKEGEALSIPNETAHACCFAVEKSMKIKKAILKIKL